MKYVKFTASTGYAGCDTEYYGEFEDNVTEEEIEECANEYAIQNGEDYEWCATGWDEDFESEDDRESYWEDCGCSWEFISKEEYDENSD